jgi:hypothetical protein
MDYLGTAGDDSIDQDRQGIAAGTQIYGLAGNDNIVVSSTIAIGGAGNDNLTASGPQGTIAYWDSPAGVTVDLQSGTAHDGFGGVDKLVNVHVVQGSGNADTLLGSSASDSFYGGAGNDLIDGRGGFDTVSFFFSPSSKFSIAYDEATGDVTVRNTDPSDGNFGTKTLRNIEQIQFQGPGSDNFTVLVSSLRPSGFSVVAGTPVNNGDAGAGARYAVTDLNGDGRKDLVLVYTADSSFSTTVMGAAPVHYFLRQADGSYQLADAAMSAGLMVANFSAVASADFNRDGKGDVVIAAAGQDPYANGAPAGPFPGELSYVLMSGSGTNDASVGVAGMPKLFAHNLAIGDLNGDGFADIFVDSIWYTPQTASYFLINDGHGGFRMDRSGLPDTISNPTVQVTQAGGNGQPLVQHYNAYTSCALFDANGDGALDLAVLPMGATDVGKVFLNDGSGHFSDAREILLPPGPFGAGSETVVSTNPYTVYDKGTIYLGTVTLDVNGDGRQDIVSITTGEYQDATTFRFYQDAALQVLINTGTGFVDESSARTDFRQVTGINYTHYDQIRAADVNDDGFTDIVLTRSESEPDAALPTRILLNDGHGVFNEAPYPVGVPDGVFIAVDPAQGEYAVAHLENLGLDPGTGFAHYTETLSAVHFDWSLGRDFFSGALVAHPETLQSDVPGRWVHGTDANNQITLSSGNERAFGYGGNDAIAGGAGNDTIDGGAGDDAIDGGTGLDVAVYSSSRSNCQLTKTASGFNVTSAGDGADALTGIERLEFPDGKIALDVGGSAGRVVKTLGAVFGAGSIGNEAYVGIGLSLVDGGMAYGDLMQLALNARLGGPASNAQVVTLLYTNVVGSVPPAADLAYYVGLLDTHQMSQASLGVLAADTGLNQANIGLVGLAASGILFV